MLTPEYVTAIEDWLKWFNEHSHRKSDLGENSRGIEQRIEFLEKGMRGAFVIMAGLTQEVERIDVGKDAAEARRALKQIIVPIGRFA